MRQMDGGTLICFYCNHFHAKHEYILSYAQASFVMNTFKNNQPNRNHANDFQGSCEPTLKVFTKQETNLFTWKNFVVVRR